MRAFHIIKLSPRLATFILLILVSIPLSQAIASDPFDSVWLRPKTGAHIQSYRCQGSLGLKIVKSDKPANLGVVLMCGAEKTDPDTYQGDLKSIEDGNTYTGIVTFEGDKLKLQGCGLGGLVCKTEYWEKVK